MEHLYSLDANYTYTVKELMIHWNLSRESVTRLIEEEPGVLIFKMQHTGKRQFRNFRIPGTVALQIENRSRLGSPE
jgi:hypothetical protein